MHRCTTQLLQSSLLLAASLGTIEASAQAWIQPAPEELHMTSIPEVPGAKAVILNRDELTDDENHMRSRYFRIKILTEAGMELGNVQAVYDRRSDGNGYTVGEIAGRTIQPDGTIVPFTGKPYEKVLHKNRTDQYTAKIFSMPAVQVGSIIEYRYKIRWEDNIFFSPDWYIQNDSDDDLFLRKGHFLWKPTDKELTHTGRGGRQSYTSALVWNPVLPPHTEIKQVRQGNGRLTMELDVKDVPPYGHEEYMPPVSSSEYHVHFYYTPYKSGQEFWATEGKYWSDDTNKFIGNSGFVRETALKAVRGAATDEEKLRKLYALTASLENTEFTRRRAAAEEKSEGLKETRSAEDVLRRERGTSDEIAATFVALARAAGFNAYAVAVVDRSRRMMNVNWMEFGQLNNVIAIVNYGGSDHFFDPGSPYCEFGHLDWKHTLSGGVRQQEKETAIIPTPGESYKYSRETRVADLKLDGDGNVKGAVTYTFQGSPATQWRQAALHTDENEVRERLKKELEHRLPSGSTVEIRSLENLSVADQPLKVNYHVESHAASVAGSRLILPADIFVGGEQAVFPHEQRQRDVYFPFAYITQDAMRVVYPAGFAVESAPAEDTIKLKTEAAYVERSKQSGDSITVWRDLLIGDFYFPLDQYPQLRKFYADFERKDHGSIILKRTSAEKASLDGRVPGPEHAQASLR